MTLDTLVMLVGALVAIIPIMQGIPDSWERPILFLLGVCVVALGVIVRRRGLGTTKQGHSTFVESAPPVSTYRTDEHESA